MFSIKEVLPVTLKTLGLKKQYNAQSVIVHWREIAGEDIAEHSWPISVERGVLLLAVDSPVWSHHLLMLKPELLGKISTFLNEKIIYDIKFQAGDVRKYKNSQEHEDSVTFLRPSILDEEELNIIWKKTETVGDLNLRKKCYYVLIKQAGLNKAKQHAGWQPCKRCSVLVPNDQKYCTVCLREGRQELKDDITRILFEAPWLSLQEIQQFVECSPREYHSAKKNLVHKLIRALFSPTWDKLNEAVLVMLMTGIKPDKVTQETIDSVIAKIKVRLAEKFRRKKYVSSPGR